MLQQGLIPISFGITGHRDVPPQDIARHQVTLRKLFDDVRASHPSSPFILITSLAEGADRIAAHIALDAGWEIGVSLPMEANSFEQDFQSSDSVEEFRQLCSKASWLRVDGRSNRPDCYAEASGWVAAHAQILIAMWDGQPSSAVGGTAHTVKIFLEGPNTPRLAIPDTGPVIQIVTRRLGRLDALPDEHVGRVVHHVPRPAGFSAEGEEERWKTILRRIDQFNGDARIVLEKQRQEIEQSRSYLNGASTIVDSAIPASAAAASWIYGVADKVSFDTQQRRNQHFWKLIVIALLAILLEQLYSGPVGHPALLTGSVVVGMVAFVLFRQGVRNRLEDRYIDYRSLAEGCRVQYFWKVAGIEKGAADHFLRDQRDELEWIRQAILGTELVENTVEVVSEKRISACQAVRNYWINDQRHYFVGTTGKTSGNKFKVNDEANARLDRILRRFMFGAVGTMVATAIVNWSVAPLMGDFGDPLVQGMIVGYGLLFAAAGVTKAYQEVKDFGGQAQRYRRTGLSMSMAQHRLDHTLLLGDVEGATHVLYEAGKMALQENNDWLLEHRERPVSVPIG